MKMKYSVEVTEKEIVETLVFNGATYTRKTDREDGFNVCKDEDFSEQLYKSCEIGSMDRAYELIDEILNLPNAISIADIAKYEMKGGEV
jgi:hypothetical protein